MDVKDKAISLEGLKEVLENTDTNINDEITLITGTYKAYITRSESEGPGYKARGHQITLPKTINPSNVLFMVVQKGEDPENHVTDVTILGISAYYQYLNLTVVTYSETAKTISSYPVPLNYMIVVKNEE